MATIATRSSVKLFSLSKNGGQSSFRALAALNNQDSKRHMSGGKFPVCESNYVVIP